MNAVRLASITASGIAALGIAAPAAAQTLCAPRWWMLEHHGLARDATPGRSGPRAV